MENQELRRRARTVARETFLREDNRYGCAEATFVTLKHVFEISDPDQSSSAMVLNGGVAYSGGVCGAISGAAMAVGLLAEERTLNHRTAKKIARQIIQQTMAGFTERFGSTACGELIAYEISIPEEHDRFIESGVWKESCMAQIEYVVDQLAELANDTSWQARVATFSNDPT